MFRKSILLPSSGSNKQAERRLTSRALAQAVSLRLPNAAARARCGICSRNGSGAGFPCQFSFHKLLHISSCHRRYIIPTLTASLNTQLKRRIVMAACCFGPEDEVHSSETWVNFYQTIRRQIPENSTLYTHRRQHLKSDMVLCCYVVFSLR
jgi:hypothetical protein